MGSQSDKAGPEHAAGAQGGVVPALPVALLHRSRPGPRDVRQHPVHVQSSPVLQVLRTTHPAQGRP